MVYSKQAQIEAASAAFLVIHHPSLTIPIPIEDIVELKLQLNIVTHKDLLKTLSIDAFLSSDLTELHIDEDHYMGSTNRSRFTLAHEVGHLVLHAKEVKLCSSIDDWKNLILGVGTGNSFKETEANIFAGCLLMPREKTIEVFDKYKKVAVDEFTKLGLPVPDDRLLVDYVSSKVAKDFDVSQKTAQIRLQNVLNS